MIRASEAGVEQRAGDALQPAEDDQGVRVRRHGAERGGEPERRHADREDAERAEDVAERAADEDQRAQRQEIGVDDPLLRGEPAAEVAAGSAASATFTTVPSMKTIDDPRIVAISVKRAAVVRSATIRW